MADSRPIPDPTVLSTEALNREIAHLKELQDEKFVGRDRALTAALASAEKAVDKTEASFSKQIASQNEKIDDLRDRVNSMDGRDKGVGLSSGIVFQGITIAVAVGAVVVAVLR